MSKFMNLLSEAIPTDDLDAIITGKRAVQRALSEAGIKVDVKHFKDTMVIRLDDGMEVTLEVVSVQPGYPVEDAEDPAKSIQAISAIASMPDAKGVLNSTSRKLRKAKKTMANAAVKIAKQFDNATQ